MKTRAVATVLGLMLWLCAIPGMAGDDYVQDVTKTITEIKGRFEAAMSDSEQQASKRIQIQVPNSLPFAHVGAYRAGGANLISINVGMNVRLSELSRAILFESKLIHDERYLLGYLRYLAYSDLFGGAFIPADNFASLYLGPSFQQGIDSLTPADAQVGQAIYANAMAFVVAHEIAHHLLGHIDDADLSGQAKRAREEAADKWAAAMMFKAGFTPTASIFTMLMFNEAYERTDKVTGNSSHPAPISRALKLSAQWVEILSNSGKPGSAVTTPFDQTMVARLLSGARALDQVVNSQAEAQRALEDPVRLAQAANGGLRHSQLRLGELYSTGTLDAIEYDIEKSRAWYRRAADNPALFDYMDQVDADSRVGWMYAFMPTELKTDLPVACTYLRRAAASSYEPAVWAYKKLISESKCSSTSGAMGGAKK
jgi:hypothetical protein